MSLLINDGYPFLSRTSAAIGLSRSQFRAALRERRVRVVFKGVYVDSSVPESRWLRLHAIRLVAPPYAVVCDCSASWLYGVDSFRPSERHLMVPSLVVPHGATRVTLPEVRCRQALMPPSDVLEIDGLLTTTPLRTTSDLLRKLWRPYALAAADGMARADLVEVDDVWEHVQRLKGYRGIVQARELAGHIERLAQSPGESWQRLRLIDAGFPRPLAQHTALDEFDRERYFDLAYPEVLLAIEYDGAEFHTTFADKEHDRSRRRYFEDVHGWRFIVSGKADILGTDPTFEREVGTLLGITPLLPRTW